MAPFEWDAAEVLSCALVIVKVFVLTAVTRMISVSIRIRKFPVLGNDAALVTVTVESPEAIPPI
jgi:hypothetical protein